MSEAAVVGGSAIEVSGVYLVPRLYMNMSFVLMMHFEDDEGVLPPHYTTFG